MGSNRREHLFISYATEDTPLAEWLTLRLTAEGYKVWCDKLQLLGGESYPRDIDKAIKEQTFRVLAILSKHSINKDNPRKERTLALSIGKKRQIDFLIPINKDGIFPHELDWMSSDLTFVPFHENWLHGLIQLLKKLESIGAPKNQPDGKNIVANWLCSDDCLIKEEEKLWTNILEILEIPEIITRYSFKQNPIFVGAINWVSYKQREGNIFWSFTKPKIDMSKVLDQQNINWKERVKSDKQTANIITYLIRRHIEEHCVQKGMIKSLEDRIYFPTGFRIDYTNYNGKNTYVKAAFERKYKTKDNLIKSINYHLSPTFRVDISDKDNPILRIIPQLYITDSSGKPLKGISSQRRRKRITKHWWNHQWLSRLIAICRWMSDNQDIININIDDNQSILINRYPIRVISPLRIKEEALSEPVHISETEFDTEGIDIIEEDWDEE